MADNEKYQTLKRETQSQLWKAYWQYVEGIATPQADSTSEHVNCMKRFWTYIKHKRADNNTIPPLKPVGVLHPDPADKADILIKQFQMAFSSIVQK